MTEKGGCQPPMIVEARDHHNEVITRSTERGQPATVWTLTEHGRTTYDRWRNER